MPTGLVTHPACLNHIPPKGHPESPDRLRAVLHGLESEGFQHLVRLEAPLASNEDIERAHSPHLVALVKQAVALTPGRGTVHIDADTAVSEGSWEASLRAAGAVVAAVDEVHAGRLRNAFCAVRPPGHHAERDRAMGFCLFNNIAIGALHARAIHGYRRVAIVDFDVHHGNGTQDIFETDSDAFYASSHQWPFYPGTGGGAERGIADNVVNVPLQAGAGSREFRTAYERTILPALERFGPDFILISAGFDGHRADPLAHLRLTEEDFGWVTKAVGAVAARCCGGRVVSALEGGYDLAALSRCAAAHVRALMEA